MCCTFPELHFMQAITPGKCTSALRHYANTYYKEKKTSTDRLRGTILGNAPIGFFQCCFILRNWSFLKKIIRGVIWYLAINIIFSKTDLTQWKIPSRLLELNEILNARLCYWHTNGNAILGKTWKSPLILEARIQVWSFFIGLYSNRAPLTPVGKRN